MAEGKFEVSSAYFLASPKKGGNLDLFLSNNILCQFNYSMRFSGVSNVKKTATACHTITALLTNTHAYMCCISYQYSRTCVPYARAKKKPKMYHLIQRAKQPSRTKGIYHTWSRDRHFSSSLPKHLTSHDLRVICPLVCLSTESDNSKRLARRFLIVMLSNFQKVAYTDENR